MPSSPVFKRNIDLIDGPIDLGVEVAVTRDPKVLRAIAEDKPFPPGDITIGDITLKASGDKPLVFREGQFSVTFGFKASTTAGLGVYSKAASLAAMLEEAGLPPEILGPGIVADDPASRLVVMRWGYSVEGSVHGAMALGPIVTVGVEAGREAFYAIACRTPNDTGARTAIAHTVHSWMLPRQVKRVSDLPPGTLLISEVGGHLGIEVGAQYGYNMTWVREAVSLGGLTGDIGLSLELRASALLRFDAEGRFAILLSRDSADPANRRIRLRLFRMQSRGWDFAFNAVASARPVFGGIPDNFDDFVEALFNVHGLQVLKDLDRWTDPAAKIGDLLGGDDDDEEATAVLSEMTGMDAAASYDDARAMLVDMLTRWSALPHRLAGVIYDVGSAGREQMDDLRTRVDALAAASKPDAALLIQHELEQVRFFESPFGRWVEAAGGSGALSALVDKGVLADLQKNARLTLAVLDGDRVEGVLRRTQQTIDRRLSLRALDNAEAGGLEAVGGWLISRLIKWLGRRINLDDIRKIRATVNAILARRHDYFNAARDALTRSYEARFSYHWQKSSTSTALLDLEFDGAAAGATRVDDLLCRAIRGEVDSVLTDVVPGVKLFTGTLTHAIERSSTLSLSVPFGSIDLDHLNKSMARVDAIDSEGGRLFAYGVEAEDVVQRRQRYQSRLAVAMQLGSGSVRVFDQGHQTAVYSFRQAVKDMKPTHLRYQLATYIDAYFSDRFNAPGAESFETWITSLDFAIDAVANNGPNIFGNTLIELEIALPPATLLAWTKAPASAKAPEYVAVSRALQRALKSFIPFCYLQDVSAFDNSAAVWPLLIYASLPPLGKVRVTGGRVAESDGDIYWDWRNDEIKAAICRDPRTIATLAVRLENVRRQLDALGGDARKTAERYRDIDIRDRIGTVVKVRSPEWTLMNSLLFAEAELVFAAREAGVAMGEFLGEASTRPTRAVKALATFGAAITDAFNKRINTVYRGQILRQLAPMVFVEAARALDPSLTDATTARRLDIVVLKEDSTYVLGSFIDGERPPVDAILRQERLVAGPLLT